MYFIKLMNMENEDNRVYIDLLNSLDYMVYISGKTKNEKQKHVT